MVKLTNVCLAFLVASFIGVGAAWSATCDDHAYTACNNKGSLIVYPLYMAADTVYTNLKLINTSDTRAVVAKVVVRSHNYSQELLDFFVYLSPNDMWDGSIGSQGGVVRVVSDDDSVWNPATSSCANAANPFNYALVNPCSGVACASDSNDYGYVEVFEAWTELWANIPKVDANNQPLEHCQAIKAVWDAFQGNPERTIQDVLAASAELVLPGNDYLDIPTYHIGNYAPTVKLTVGEQTFIGELANNSICEVEAAISKDEFYIPYYNTAESGTLGIFTFPTKLSDCPDCDPLTGAVINRLLPVSGNFFTVDGIANNGNDRYRVNYQLTIYDMMENSLQQGCPVSPCELITLRFPEEVNFLNSSSAPYAKGWMRVFFNQVTNCASDLGDAINYTGAPVMGIVAQVTPDGIAVSAPSVDFGNVICNGNFIGDYQVSPEGVAGPAPVCDIDHLNLCGTQADCEGAGGNWCDGACQADPCDGAGTVIGGEDVDCATECTVTFPGNIPSIVQCEAWQDANCQ